MLVNLSSLILIILILTASFFDVKEKRIPNFLTFPVMIIGLVLNIIMNGLNGVVFSFFGFIMGLIVFFIPFTLGFMGGGDVKLMASIGALKGFKFTMLSTLFSAIAGIIVVFAYLIYKKKLFSYFRKYFVFVTQVFLRYVHFSDSSIIGNKLKKFAYFKKVENVKEEKLYVPYGLAIAIGTLVVLSGILNEYIIF